MAIHTPLASSDARNRLAAELAARRRHKPGNEAGWTKGEVQEMEANDAEFNSWEADLEWLRSLLRP